MNANSNFATTVVGMDGSVEAGAALTWARTNAGRDDRIVVVRAWELQTMLEEAGPETGEPGGFAELAKYALDKSLASVSDQRVVPVVGRGRPGEVIVNEAKDADLIVVGHRGDSRIALMLGSTANYVLHHARCPVVVVRGTADRPVRRVVVGIDAHHPGGEAENESVRALRWAYALGGVEEVCLVHGWFLPPIAFGMTGSTQLDVQALDQSAAAQIELVAEAAGPAPDGVKLTRRVVRAPGAVALTDASSDADLVVVGSRGRGALRGLLLGSTSAEVAARAHSPVAVIR